MQSSCCVHLEDQEYHVKSLISTKVLSFTNYQNDHLMLLLDNQYTTHCNQFDMRKKILFVFTTGRMFIEKLEQIKCVNEC